MSRRTVGTPPARLPWAASRAKNPRDRPDLVRPDFAHRHLIPHEKKRPPMTPPIQTSDADQPIWRPDAERLATANLTGFRTRAEKRWQVALPDFDALWRWSVAQREQFWLSVWEETGIVGEGPGK